MWHLIFAGLWFSTCIWCDFGIHVKHLTERLEQAQAPVFHSVCPQEDAEAGMKLQPGTLMYTNLGNHGPDTHMAQGMLFSNVFPRHPGVDMLISVDGPYFPPGPEENRMYNEFFGINVGSGSSITLKVTFIKEGTAHEEEVVRVKAPDFIFTVASLDKFPHDLGAKQSINVTGSSAYAYTEDSEIMVIDNVSWAMFQTDSLADTNASAPRHAFAMDDEMKRKSVAFFYSGSKGFEMTLAASPGASGRTFYFTAASNLVCESRALCEGYVCPDFYEVKDDAADLYCMTDVCDSLDTGVCCQAALPDECKPVDTLLFPPDSLMYSNLAGKGPDFDSPHSILYEDVFPSSGELVLLNITALSNYSADNSSKNGLHGEYSVINVEAGYHVDLRFDFTTKSGETFVLQHPFYFTVYDFDEQKDGGGKEQVIFSGYESYVLSKDTTVIVGQDNLGRTTFTAGAYGNETDNPTNPTTLSKSEMRKTVSIKFATGTSTFNMTLAATEGFKGRNFEFTGFSTLPCPDKALCDTMECPEGTSLTQEAKHTYCGGWPCNETDIPKCCWATGEKRMISQIRAATCGTFRCPHNMVPKDQASEITCADEECTEFDTTTCCDLDHRPYCSNEYALVLSKAELFRCNSSGYPKEIRFLDVFPGRPDDGKFDLVVKIKGDRSAIGEATGLQGALGQVQFKGPGHVELDFRVQHRHTNETPAKMWPFLFSLVDFVVLEGGRFYVEEKEGFTDDDVILTRDSRLKVDSLNRTVEPRLAVLEPAKTLHPMALTRAQKRNTATMLMEKANFKMNIVIGSPVKSGRKLSFAGGSNMVCPFKASCTVFSCPLGYSLREDAALRVCRGSICEEADTATCCTCTETSALAFNTKSVVESNLGGFGPGAGAERILVADVFPRMGGREIDLEITAMTPYFPFNSSMNGMNGEFLSVNLRSGTSVDLRFKFVDRATKAPFKAEPFFFSVFDLDKQADGGSQESVVVEPYLWHRLSEKSFVTEEDGMFTGTVPGKQDDNPSNALALEDDHISRSISFMMDSTNGFVVRLSVKPGWTGRNILFAGNSVVTCERKALCSNFTCPHNYIRRSGADRSVCHGKECLRGVDDAACCTKPSTWKVSHARWYH